MEAAEMSTSKWMDKEAVVYVCVCVCIHTHTGILLSHKKECIWVNSNEMDEYFGHLMQRTDSFEKTLCWERLKVGGEGDDRGWDGWMASPTQWTWIWVNSGSWWWTGKPGVLQSMESQRVRNDWVTKLNWEPIIESETSQKEKNKYHILMHIYRI